MIEDKEKLLEILTDRIYELSLIYQNSTSGWVMKPEGYDNRKRLMIKNEL